MERKPGKARPMRAKVKKLWPSSQGKTGPLPVTHINAMLDDSRSRDEWETIQDLPGTGRVVFHFSEGLLKMVECFDEGPSRRDVKNSKGGNP